METIKQHWNNKIGKWEPETNKDYMQNSNAKELAKFLSHTFCHDLGEQEIYEWLHKAKEN